MVDGKKGGGGGGWTKSPGQARRKLNPSTKAFVPSGPAPSSPARSSSASNGGQKGAAGKPSAPPVWGKKSMDAVRAAPTLSQAAAASSQPARHQQPQKQHQQQGRGDSNGWRKSGSGRSGRGGKNNDSGGGWGKTGGRGSGRGGRGGDRGGGRSADRPARGRGNHDRGGSDTGASDDAGWQRGKPLSIELCKPGEGRNDDEKAIKRITIDDLLALRLPNVEPPSNWGDDEPGPPEEAAWTSPTRLSEIQALVNEPRTGRPVKRHQNDTAPPLEDCKPLEVNDETRWKARVFNETDKADDEDDNDQEADDVILKKALLILNKLSLTKFDKLSDDFIETGIGRSPECLTGAIGQIVSKAQDEPHFAAMYASLCLKLAKTPLEGIDDGAKKGKVFKKMLLDRCQQEFEQNSATKIAEALKGIDDQEEQAYRAGIVKKHYVGHMRFIGELYKVDLISIKVMIHCLPSLLIENMDEDVDEEKVECFVKLMTTIGASLEQQSEKLKMSGKMDTPVKLDECWKMVETIAGKRKEKGPKVSNRIKFMLQDLIEMKDKGWVTRRKEETAKTLAQIHKEVAKEEAQAARRSVSTNSLRSMASQGSSSSLQLRRGTSSGDVRNLDKRTPVADAEGFVEVASKGFGRSNSVAALARSTSEGNNNRSRTPLPKKGEGMRRSESIGGSFAALNKQSSESRKGDKKDRAGAKPSREENESDADQMPSESQQTAAPSSLAGEAKPKPQVEYLDANECGKKAQSIFKEYFVGGDTDDAVLSIDELIGAGAEGSAERGIKVLEDSCLLVMEMKQMEVDKLLVVALRCFQEGKLEKESILGGLHGVLEFLNDIEIDAPLAGGLLASIVAEFVKVNGLSFDFLLSAPDYFRSDGKPAQFGSKVLKKIGGDALDNDMYLDVIEKLMTEDDKAAYSSARDLIAA